MDVLVDVDQAVGVDAKLPVLMDTQIAEHFASAVPRYGERTKNKNGSAGLDVQSILTIRDLIRELNQEGLTIFLTTHNMEEAEQLCDKIAIINHGKIAAIDTPERLRGVMRELQCVEVSFNKPPSIGELSALSHINEVRRVGKIFRLYTNSPFDLIEEIIDYGKRNNLKLTWLQVLAPRFEDVFLKITEGKN